MEKLNLETEMPKKKNLSLKGNRQLKVKGTVGLSFGFLLSLVELVEFLNYVYMEFFKH